MNDVTEELEQCAAELRQRAWLLAEFHQALRSAGIPDMLAHDLVADYHRDELIPGYDPDDDE